MLGERQLFIMYYTLKRKDIVRPLFKWPAYMANANYALYGGFRGWLIVAPFLRHTEGMVRRGAKNLGIVLVVRRKISTFASLLK